MCVSLLKEGYSKEGYLKEGTRRCPEHRLKSQITNWLQVTISHLQTGHGGVWRLPCSPGLLAEEELGRKGETQGANVLEMRVPGYAVLPGLTLVSLS